MQELLQAFQANAESLWATVFRLVANAEDARDCVQQTYIDASKLNADSVKDWRAVLFRIATRRAMDLLRKRYRRKETFSEVLESVCDYQLDSDLQLTELREAVRVQLSQLPVNQAQAFWLRHVEQFTNSEVAEALDLSSENVRVLVHRATLHLRKHLNPAFDDSLSMESQR